MPEKNQLNLYIDTLSDFADQTKRQISDLSDSASDTAHIELIGFRRAINMLKVIRKLNETNI